MRPIKFRGKRIDNGEWVYGDLVMVCNGETLKRYPCIVISYNYDAFDWHEVQPETVGQFTELTDKNGREVYEGDIVRVVSHSDYESIDFKVSYFLGSYILLISEEKGHATIHKYTHDAYRNDKIDNFEDVHKLIEVIGNIHEGGSDE